LKSTTNPFFVFLFFAFISVSVVSAQQSVFSAKMSGFTRTLSAQLEAKTGTGSAIAIADFDNADDASKKLNLGYAVSEIVTQDFHRSGYFLVLEKKQLQQILRTMELQLSGLYDSDKAAAIGKLIDARFLMVGSIIKTAGFYRVSVRIVEVETGSILISDSVEIDAELLESATEKYQPPRYRLFIGSSMNWFATTKASLGTYSIGLTMGASYEIANNHWLSFQTIYFFGHYGYYDSKETGDYITSYSFASSYYRLVHTFVMLAEYGYRISVSRVISIQPSLGFGAVIGGLNAQENYYTWTPLGGTADSSYVESMSLWASPVAQLRFDLVFLEKNPVSFYIGTGYFVYPFELSKSHHSFDTNVLLNGIKLEGALMMHF